MIMQETSPTPSPKDPQVHQLSAVWPAGMRRELCFLEAQITKEHAPPYNFKIFIVFEVDSKAMF